MNKTYGFWMLGMAIAFAIHLLLTNCTDDVHPPIPYPIPSPEYTTPLATWEAKFEDLTGFIDEETCYPAEGGTQELMKLRRYTGCKGFNVTADVPLEYWYLKELEGDAKEETWLCVAHGEGDMDDNLRPFVVFEDPNNFIYPTDAGRLNINMKVKIAQRDTYNYPKGTLPHLTYEGVHKKQNKVVYVVLFTSLECVGNDGKGVAHLRYNNDGGFIWAEGADPGARFPCMLSPANNGFGNNDGLHNSAWSIQPYKQLGGTSTDGEGISNLALPPTEGYLRWTIKTVDIFGGFDPYGWVEFQKKYGDGDLWAILINNVEITTTDADKYDY